MLAQARQIDAVLVTELSRWGRNTKDLLETLDELHDRGVSVLPLNGQSFDIDSANGRLMRTLIAALAEFERDLIKERVKSGLAQVKATFDKDGHFITKSDKVRKKLGRKYGYRLSDRYTKNVLEMHGRRQLPPDRPQPRPVPEHGDADRAARTRSGSGLKKTAPSLPSVEKDPCIEIGASVP